MKALISGISGQDGSYLAEFLLAKGYEVIGIERRVALQDQAIRNERVPNGVKILPCDITDYGRVVQIIQETMPDEIYHLAAQSFVAESFVDPFQTMSVNVMGTLNILEAVRKFSPKSKLYFAASSEIFGKVSVEPQNENTPLHPRSPYGVSKACGFLLTRNYREAYNLFACSGILFNHESPRRGKEFVTRKITDAIGKIKRHEQDFLTLGNLEIKRDWGFSGDYVEAMWLMLQQDEPDDYVIGTGISHSLLEFIDAAFTYAGLDYQKHVRLDKSFERPSDVICLRADSTKAREKFGWVPKVSFDDLVEMMVDGDK